MIAGPLSFATRVPRPASRVPVRLASPQDAAPIASLLGELGYPTDAGSVRTRMRRLLTEGGADARDIVFLAVEPELPQPLGLLALHRFTALHDDADVALIMALVVAEQARGRGVGRQLVDAAAEAARGWGCTRMLVTTHVRRADAHAFYERLQFEFTGRRYVLTL
jgi:aminoglycoside 6'-N-acetyltransferase I